MNRKALPIILSAAVCATVGIGLTAAPAVAKPPPRPDPLTTVLAPGQGCPGFWLGVKEEGGTKDVRVVRDSSGTVIETVTTRTGVVVTYSNFGSKKKAKKAEKQVIINTPRSVLTIRPEGTIERWIAEGSNGLVLFPTDIPAGPSTSHYEGKIEYTVDTTTGVFTLTSVNASKRDICAELTVR